MVAYFERGARDQTMGDELKTDELRIRIHAKADTNNRVRGKVFAKQISDLISSLEDSDKIENGGVRHDYVITGLEQRSAQACLTQIVSSHKPRTASPIAILPKILTAIVEEDAATLVRFAGPVARLAKFAKGAGDKYSHTDLQINGAASFRIDEFFERRAVRAVEVSKPAAPAFYAGIVYGSFDGVVKEVDLRGDTPRLKLILSAGSVEIDCTAPGVSIPDIRAALNARAWVSGRAFYHGDSGLPERVEISEMKPISSKPDILRWAGKFGAFDVGDWD